MAYSSTNPVVLVSAFGITNAKGLFLYSSSHASTDITASNFFTNCGFGAGSTSGQTGNCANMRVGDILMNHNTQSNAVTLHSVTSISSSTGGTFQQSRHANVSAGTS